MFSLNWLEFTFGRSERMTNTTYFHSTIRDDISTSSDETWNQQQREKPDLDQEERAVAKVEHSLYSVIGKAINAWISPRSGAKPKFCSGKYPTYDPCSDGEKLEFSILKCFSFTELKTATMNFHPDGKLGGGCFGSVFKGWIAENTLTATKPGKGTAVAVKKLDQNSFQGQKKWLTEAKYLGQLHHINLVRLFGYCSVDNQHLLVYEFMHRGSLDNHLFRRASSCLLSWSLRMKIALGAAKGLAFLHNAEINVICRDFKSSHILLDSNYNAKLSDFGLAKDGPTGDRSHVSTCVMGTYGYAAPEYIATGHLTAKNDVYGFGVVLLEMLSGRRAMDKNMPSGQHSLAKWAKPYLLNKRKIFHVLDRRLEGQYSLESALKAANISLRCIAQEAKLRPNMDEVVTVLEQLQDSKDAEEHQK